MISCLFHHQAYDMKLHGYQHSQPRGGFGALGSLITEGVYLNCALKVLLNHGQNHERKV